MTDAVSNLKPKEVMAEIVGRRLSSVTFVQDYIQLLSMARCQPTYTLPTVSFRGQSLKLDKDYVGPEALMFSLDRNRGWIVV
jgi:hypothetical protein